MIDVFQPLWLQSLFFNKFNSIIQSLLPKAISEMHFAMLPLTLVGWRWR